MRKEEYHLQLSKFLSLVLRHKPAVLELELDNQGFVPLDEFLSALQKQPRWREVTESDILEVIDNSDKKRFELVEGKIRALYGHSLAVEVEYPEVEPPPNLYHGTAWGSVPQILEEGLKPEGRRYVHLSALLWDAVQIGRRRDPNPVILRVKTEEARNSGIRFFSAGGGSASGRKASDGIFLTEEIPPEFLEIVT